MSGPPYKTPLELVPMPPAPPTRVITFGVHGYGGWDALLVLLPRKWQVSIVARRLVRSTYPDWDFAETGAELRVAMPWGETYRILGADGRTTRCVGPKEGW